MSDIGSAAAVAEPGVTTPGRASVAEPQDLGRLPRQHWRLRPASCATQHGVEAFTSHYPARAQGA